MRIAILAWKTLYSFAIGGVAAHSPNPHIHPTRTCTKAEDHKGPFDLVHAHG